LDAGEYDAVRHRIEHTHTGLRPQVKSRRRNTYLGGVSDGVELVLALLEFFI
jgi:hypothetical protein